MADKVWSSDINDDDDGHIAAALRAATERDFVSPIRFKASEPAPLPPPPVLISASSSSTGGDGNDPNGAAPVPQTSALEAGTIAQPPQAGRAPTATNRRGVDKILVKQAAMQQTQVLRAIAHRAAAEMEEWSLTVGSQQQGELLLYWGAWERHIGRVMDANERALNYLKTVASSTAKYADTINNARQLLEPLATGEFATGTAAGAAGGAAQASASKGKAGGAAATPRGHSRAPLSTSVLAGNIVDIHGQISGVLSDFAKTTANDCIGEPEIADPSAKGKGSSSSSSAKTGKDGAPPTDLAGMVAWYDHEAGEVRKIGSALASALNEAQATVSRAFEEFDSITAGYLTSAGGAGSGNITATAMLAAGAPGKAPSAKPGSGVAGGPHKDLWLAELHFRRASRALLAAKQIYLNGMAGLFERYRRAESVRTEALARAFEGHALAVSKLFERVSAKGVIEAARALHTHADFCGVVENQARQAILDSRRRAMASRMGGLAARPAAGSATAAVGGAGSYSSNPGHQQAQQAHQAHLSSEHIHFSLDTFPAVISPFASPLVVRCGMLARQSGLLKSWKPCVAVLTRDCNLHLFGLEVDVKASGAATGTAVNNTGQTGAASLVLKDGSEDLATHPDVLQALFRPAAGGCMGHGGTQLEASASTAAEAGGAGARAGSSSSSGAEGASSEDIADAAAGVARRAAAAVAAAAGAAVSSRSGVRLPPPALSSQLLQYASAYSTRVGDLLPVSLGGTAPDKDKGSASSSSSVGVQAYMAASGLDHVVALVKRHDAAPSASVELTATTKVAFAPTVGPHVLEISDSKAGWFGGSTTSKVHLRATGADDMLDWIVACNGVVEALAQSTA